MIAFADKLIRADSKYINKVLELVLILSSKEN